MFLSPFLRLSTALPPFSEAANMSDMPNIDYASELECVWFVLDR